MERFESGFGEWVVKYRWWVIILTALLVLATASGVRYLTFTNDSRVFFSEENPQLKALEALENTYNKIDNVLFIIAPKDGNVFTRQTLSAVEELTKASWEIPYSSRVDSITNFQHTSVDGDDLMVRDLVENAKNLTGGDIKRIKGIALSEIQLVNNLVSPTGHVAGVNVNILLPGDTTDEPGEVAAFARDLAADLRQNFPAIDVYITGAVMFDNAFAEATIRDMTTIVPAMYLVLLVLMGTLLRSLAGTVSTLIIIVISMSTGMGLAGWLGIVLTPASAGAPTIILTLAVADSVHILATMFQQMRVGKTKHEAIVESLRINLQPIFITSVSTGIGFLAMNFSDAPPFRDLGNIVAMGIMSAFVYSVLFLPAIMAVLPLRIKPRRNGEGMACDSLARFVIKHQKPLFRYMLVVIILLAAGISRIKLEDNFVTYFDHRYDIRVASDFAINNLTGMDVIEYSLESGEPGGINDPEYLNKVDAFAQWFREMPQTVHVTTITDTMKRLNKNMHGDDKSYYKIPEQRDLAAQYLLLYEMSLPFGLDLNNQINVDKSASRMLVIFRNFTTKELRAVEEKARAWLRNNAPESMFTYGSGLSIVWAHISERNINSMLGGSFLALALISVLMIFALRSLKYGILSLIPNLVPAFTAFGIWGMAVGQVGLALSVIIAMTLGIVVDDTVHFLTKYLRARREHGMAPPEAVRYSFNTVGTALWVTTAILVAGFFVLSFSGFKLNSDMGLMTAITITLALAMDFLFLPTLLMKVEGEKP